MARKKAKSKGKSNVKDKAKTKKTTKKVAKKATKKAAQKATKKSAAKISKKTTVKVKAKKIKASKKTAPLVAMKETASMVNLSAPHFHLKNSVGADVDSLALKGKKIVLYFYPKDDTPGCTLEGQEFNQLLSSFEAANTVVFGISKDDVATHDKFKCKYGFKFELLADVNEELSKKFDVIKEKNMYGKKYMGIERSTFVIDENQNIVAEYRKVSPPGHAQEVLNFVKNLN